MRTWASLFIALLWWVLAAGASAQETAPASYKPQVPYVEFGFQWDQGRPWTGYTISVEQSGRTHFHGVPNPAEDNDSEPFDGDFSMSPANLQKIFGEAKALNYFRGDFEIKQKNIAKTGVKTLTYRGDGVEGSATYNYSRNTDVQELTKLFQSIAMTLDYGRKLQYQYRFDKLGMDSRLNELVDLQKSGFTEELQAIEPILRKIADDPNMMNIARKQAKQLLKQAASSQPAAPSSELRAPSRQLPARATRLRV